jgi:hypothetical protein
MAFFLSDTSLLISLFFFLCFEKGCCLSPHCHVKGELSRQNHLKIKLHNAIRKNQEINNDMIWLTARPSPHEMEPKIRNHSTLHI